MRVVSPPIECTLPSRCSSRMLGSISTCCFVLASIKASIGFSVEPLADRTPPRIAAAFSDIPVPDSETWLNSTWSHSQRAKVAAVGKKHLQVWDASTSTPIFSIKHGCVLPPTASKRIRIRFSPDGNSIAMLIPGTTTLVKRWYIPSGREASELVIAGIAAADFAFASTSDQLIVLGEDGRLVRVLPSGEEVERRLIKDPASYESVHLSFDATSAVCLVRKNNSHHVLEWRDLPHNDYIDTPSPMASLFDRFAVAPDGRMFAGAYTDFDARPPRYRLIYRSPVKPSELMSESGLSLIPACLSISHGGCYILVGDNSRSLALWDTINGSQVAVLEGNSIPGQLAFSADTLRALVLSANGAASLLDIGAAFRNRGSKAVSIASHISDLGSPASLESANAYFSLIRHGDDAVMQVGDCLAQTVAKADRVKQLYSALDSDDFHLRSSASSALIDMGPPALELAPSAASQSQSPELKLQVELVRRSITTTPLSPRVKRCIAILEAIATPNAIAALNTLTNHPSSLVRVEIQSSLRSLTPHAAQGAAAVEQKEERK